MLTSTVEDYLKTILYLEDMQERASTSGVARRLAVADATVTDMMRKLQKAGLLEYRPYYGVTLTDKGRQSALNVLRRHRLIELFLHRTLGYGWELVHEEAERLEHVVSDLFVERLDALLGFPAKDPHGEVIPDATGHRQEERLTCLADAPPGVYTILQVKSREPGFLTFLEQQGLIPSRSLSLLERIPFQGPLKIKLSGKRVPQYLGLEAAKCIFAVSADQHEQKLLEVAKNRTRNSTRLEDRQVLKAKRRG
ncbi:MAG TPA: metal-dependent transcriptional regulator [Terriglobia bacterium]|nr:metal-dependent transcriptional regulator [Terriglobia bacterium]